LARNQFDNAGALINGKKIPTADLPMGDYRMAITVTDPATRERAIATFQFRISDRNPSPMTWDISDPDGPDDARDGKRDYQRALCYLSHGDLERATTYLRKANEKGPNDETRSKLVGTLYQRQAFDEVVTIYSKGGITAESNEQAVLQVAESLNRVGQ